MLYGDQRAPVRTEAGGPLTMKPFGLWEYRKRRCLVITGSGPVRSCGIAYDDVSLLDVIIHALKFAWG